MLIPIHNGRVTAGFSDPRPLSNPGAHVHGAIDVAGGTGLVVAPCSGKLQAYVFLRQKDGWARDEKTEILALPPRDYWYDTYGGIIAIEDLRGEYHLLCHFYASKLQARFGTFTLVESKGEGRQPPIALLSKEVYIKKGEPLVHIGNAGFSTAAHLHWEVHHTRDLEPYAARIDPMRRIE